MAVQFMETKKASTISTGGGGYTFADKVAAGFLAQMLKGNFPLEPHLGPIVGLHFETSESGHSLDDLSLILERESQQTRLLTSVKSSLQLTKAGFNDEFVDKAWEEWNGSGTDKQFNPNHDLLGLVAGIVEDAAMRAWQTLQKQAIATTPERMLRRLTPNGQSSAIARKIFESLRASANQVQRDATGTLRFLTRIRVLPFSDAREGEFLNLCAEIVRDGSQSEGARLWDRLVRIAAESRSTGAYFDVPKLVAALRPDFELKDYPDFEADWSRIESTTRANLDDVRTVVGYNIHLPRNDAREKVAAAIREYAVTIVAGESGSGKTSVVSGLLASGQIYARLLWLTSGQLSKSSHAEIAHSLNLRHTVPELIANSGTHPCSLVIDGFEKFEGDARRNAVALLRAVRDRDFAGWKVIITCQPQALETVRDALVDAGIANFHRLDFEKPDLQEILDALRDIPGIRPLLLRSELQPVLRNLLVLDWVLRADVPSRFTATRPWIGETEIIECIWERWIGNDRMNLARDGLLRTLGQREGERLSGAVHIGSIPQDQLPLLGELRDQGLVRVEGASVRFSHDLMGDWARYRVLTFAENDAALQIKQLARIPRWSRAIRLYAQSLAEQSTDLSRWRSLAEQLAGGDPDSQVASDLFLDALIFAPNSEFLLEQVWPQLIADDAQILRRLLKRLLHVASFPDWRFQGEDNDPKLQEQSEVWFRIPHPLYWYPVLRVLSRHSKEIAAVALAAGAEVCVLWLRTMPEEMFGRQQAAHLAIDLAKEMQGLVAAARRHLWEKDSSVYEAVLYAGRDFPDEVAQIAIELSGRREEPAYALERAAEEHERKAKFLEEWYEKHPEEREPRRVRVPGSTSYRRKRMRPPAADGPQREIPDAFRSAVLQTPALGGLIAKRPEVATEVLLAVCIEEPREIDADRGGIFWRDNLGLEDWKEGSPGMYWKGPFLPFLESSPEHGLAAIIRLVNYATTQWLRNGVGPYLSEQESREYGLEFEVGDKKVFWTGDRIVLGWHRGLTIRGQSVECALMALERWLYGEIEAGRSIEQRVQYIFDHGHSLAFAGVLVSLGLKHQELFKNELQPLLGSYYLHEWQYDLADMERDSPWIASLYGQPPAMVKLASEWHRQPHRYLALRDVAAALMLRDEATREYLAKRKAAWATEIQVDGQARVSLEFFLASFDPANYVPATQADESSVPVPVLRWPAPLQAIDDQTREKAGLIELTVQLPRLSRQLLDAEKTLPEQQIPGFVEFLRRLSELQFEGPEAAAHERRRVDSLAGALAFLVAHHRAWLLHHKDVETWVFDTLQSLRPVRNDHRDSQSKSDHEAELFLGEAGISLLLESNDEWVLRLVFEGLTGTSYQSTLHTMFRAYLLREQLGERFSELLNIVVLWSALRRAATAGFGQFASAEALSGYKTALFQRFKAGKLKGAPIPISRAALLGNRLVERVERKTLSRGDREWSRIRKEQLDNREDDREFHRDLPDIDIEVLRHGFTFLRAMILDARPSDAALLRERFQELFELEIGTLHVPASADDHRELLSSHYDFDSWIMKLTAEFIAQAKSLDIARLFYRPILNVGPAAIRWVEDFLEAWVTMGLPLSTDRAAYVRIWQDIVAYSSTLATLQPGKTGYSCPAESLAVDLVGMHETAAQVLGDTQFADVVTAMADTFAQWTKRWLIHASIVHWYSNFLTTESGRVILSQGIRQLAPVVDSFSKDDWDRYRLGAMVTAAVAACWKHLRVEIQANASLRDAFLRILTALCARQVPEALNLQRKVSEALAA